MMLSLTFAGLSQAQVNALVQAAVMAGIAIDASVAAPVPSAGTPAAPHAPPPPQPPQPVNLAPPAPAPAAPPAPPAPAQPTGLLGQVLAAMDKYVAVNGVPSLPPIFAMLGIKRAQDANPEQMAWLLQAFSNTAWKP